MPLTPSLLNSLQRDFPHITFRESDAFSWSPTEKAVSYSPTDPDADALILHELSHAILGHEEYPKDVALLAMETAAWDHAKGLADTYKVVVEDDTAEANLDTYRDWLHARSTCPACKATGYETTPRTYSCVACSGSWTVNEARLCALRRYKIHPR
ncbi:hypothetical protein GW746_02560 [Candidatus Saccharibacteria bacterium]|nr:hypothetical protein [Candidatus Saccharibacteria bacterium]NCS83275.1 hypothetical protein [Candidatus Saccharibacteria bacterium]